MAPEQDSTPRFVTGIEGLDALLYGGIPKGSQIIITGGPGAGKTLLSFEFLYKSAIAGNTGVFFAFDEPTERIIENAKSAFPEFTEISNLLQAGKIIIQGEEIRAGSQDSETATYQFGKLVSEMESIIVSTNAQTVVIDSMSLLDMMIVENKILYRKSIMALVSNLRRLGVTSIVTMELESLDRQSMRFKSEYFIFDGIIAMYEGGEDTKRQWSAEVIKMRGTRHSFVTIPYEITPYGFKFYSSESNATP